MSEAELAEASAETISFVDYSADHEPIEGRLTLAGLRESSCRWPSGDPRDLSTFRYCGEPKHQGPYCESHAVLAYLVRVGRY